MSTWAWIGVMAGAVLGVLGGLLAGAVVGAVVGMVFWGEDKAREWERRYWELKRQRGTALLEVTLREPDGGVVAMHNLVALSPDLILAALRLVALGRDFTVRQMQPLLTEEQFNALRDELVERGYLVHRGPRKAAGWTAQGEALVEEVKRSCLAVPDLRGEETGQDSRWGGGVVGIAAWERGAASPRSCRKEATDAVG